jgi:hypothetical protein
LPGVLWTLGSNYDRSNMNSRSKIQRTIDGQLGKCEQNRFVSTLAIRLVSRYSAFYMGCTEAQHHASGKNSALRWHTGCMFYMHTISLGNPASQSESHCEAYHSSYMVEQTTNRSVLSLSMSSTQHADLWKST